MPGALILDKTWCGDDRNCEMTRCCSWNQMFFVLLNLVWTCPSLQPMWISSFLQKTYTCSILILQHVWGIILRVSFWFHWYVSFIRSNEPEGGECICERRTPDEELQTRQRHGVVRDLLVKWSISCSPSLPVDHSAVHGTRWPENVLEKMPTRRRISNCASSVRTVWVECFDNSMCVDCVYRVYVNKSCLISCSQLLCRLCSWWSLPAR